MGVVDPVQRAVQSTGKAEFLGIPLTIGHSDILGRPTTPDLSPKPPAGALKTGLPAAMVWPAKMRIAHQDAPVRSYGQLSSIGMHHDGPLRGPSWPAKI